MNKITMELLSDALPGSGEGLAGFIDSDIVFDQDGIPYIPGKRIKGILRESLEELKDAKLTKKEPETIFGKGGEGGTGCSFRISNGYLENLDSYRKVIADKDKIFNREQVLDYFTYIRAQTAVDTKLGSAVETSLRVSRVLKKGLKFVFPIQFDNEHREVIEDILKVTRFFGHNRTRGLGNIKLTLNDLAEKKSSKPLEYKDISKTKDEGGLYSIKVTFQNISQLLLSVKVGQSQVTETYIPGSIILGALANHYIRKKKIEADTDENFRDIFVSGKVIFENAYPYWEHKVYYPIPISFSKDKETDKIHDKAKPDVKEIKIKGTQGEYAYLSGNGAEVISRFRQISYHHRRPDDKAIGHAFKEKLGTASKNDTGEFFQFEVLPPGQNFVSKIIGSYDLIKELSSQLSKEMDFYLGKSKTAQYGLTKVNFENIEKYTPFLLKEEWIAGGEMIFILLSDMILVNKNGLSSPDASLFVDELKKELGVDEDKITLERKFLKYKNIGGYLGVWNLPKIQNPAIAAGSVIVLKNNSKDNLKLSKAISRSYGLRTEEGYGRISAFSKPFETIEVKEITPFNPLEPNDSEPDDKFVEHLLKSHIKSYFKKDIYEKNFKKPVSSSFVGRIQAIIKGSSNFKELGERLTTLKTPAKDKLKKIREDLFLSIEKDNVLVNKQSFIKEVGKTSDVYKVFNKLYKDTKNRMDTLIKNNLFEFYLEYALNLLSLFKFNLRKNKEASNEPNK